MRLRCGRKWQAACKPNFVEDDHSSRRRITANAHSDLPAGFAHRAGTRVAACAATLPAYLVLLRVGFTMPPTLQPKRCALTAPFHPYRTLAEAAVFSLWHLPSRSLDAPVPDVIRHTALRSSDFPLPVKLCSSPAAIAQPPALPILPPLGTAGSYRGNKFFARASAQDDFHGEFDPPCEPSSSAKSGRMIEQCTERGVSHADDCDPPVDRALRDCLFFCLRPVLPSLL